MTEWKCDVSLRQDLQVYVERNHQRKEVLDVVEEKYPMYDWSLRTLCRRMQYFNIRHVDLTVDVKEMETAIKNILIAVSISFLKKEMEGLGRLLGYRALHRKIREVHVLYVPRDIVYVVMSHVDREGLRARGSVGIPKRPKRKNPFMVSI